jgi:hypothetical protein
MTFSGQVGSMLATAKKEEPIHEGRAIRERQESPPQTKKGFLKWLTFSIKNSSPPGH